jgi:hypothetical protein
MRQRDRQIVMAGGAQRSRTQTFIVRQFSEKFKSQLRRVFAVRSVEA